MDRKLLQYANKYFQMKPYLLSIVPGKPKGRKVRLSSVRLRVIERVWFVRLPIGYLVSLIACHAKLALSKKQHMLHCRLQTASTSKSSFGQNNMSIFTKIVLGKYAFNILKEQEFFFGTTSNKLNEEEKKRNKN